MGSALNIPSLDITGILRRYGLRPDKRLGQNFLLDPVALQRVVAAGDIASDDRVLEIGPGLGSLTRYLAEASHQVVAVELDERLIPPLQEILSSYENVQLVQGDILKQNLVSLMEKPGYLVIANIPYYITSAVIRRLLETDCPPSRLVLTVQLEVAHRICALPGDLSLLALGVQVYGRPKISTRIPAGAFYPVPKVDSAVVRVDIYDKPKIPFHQLDMFFRLTKAGFAQRRKTLRNTLSAGLGWPKDKVETFLQSAGIDHMRRAETLNLEEWGTLVEKLQETESA